MFEYPFLRANLLNPGDAIPLEGGPSVEEMRELELNHAGVELTFQTSSKEVRVVVESILPHPTRPDSWWLHGELPNSADHVGILWTPGSPWYSYLIEERYLLDFG